MYDSGIIGRKLFNLGRFGDVRTGAFRHDRTTTLARQWTARIELFIPYGMAVAVESECHYVTAIVEYTMVLGGVRRYVLCRDRSV